tara:strand:+ start:121 stop:288 length:168 start_codon:yes stop_codon:yes gene_type:complete
MFVGLYVCMFNREKRVDISMVVKCDASDIIGYDRRRPELSNVALHNKQNTTSIEK